MGWDPMDDRWWLEIAEALPKPWPREAVLFDLRWWASRVRRGVGRRPGRPALMARYGWTERTLRDLIASGVWEDPAKAKGPAEVQPRSSEGPETAPKVAVSPTPEVQQRSSEGPAEVPTRVGDTEHTAHTQTQEATAADLANPGPPGDLPGKSADPFYAAIWLDSLRAAGLLAPDVRLSPREAKDATRIARDAGGDRDRLEATARWVRESGAFEASRARENVERGSLRWLLGDWTELDRLAHANGHRVRPKRETADEMEARLAREAQQRRAADG